LTWTSFIDLVVDSNSIVIVFGFHFLFLSLPAI
jgi:hypothetical protein